MGADVSPELAGQAGQLLYAPNSPWMKVLDSDQDKVLSDGSLDHIPSFDVAFFFGQQQSFWPAIGSRRALRC
jgi:hypothetical protein